MFGHVTIANKTRINYFLTAFAVVQYFTLTYCTLTTKWLKLPLFWVLIS